MEGGRCERRELKRRLGEGERVSGVRGGGVTEREG